MKALNLLLFSFILFCVGCKESHKDFLQCAKEKGLFLLPHSIPLSLDTIKTYSKFRNYAKYIRDTISDCQLMFGVVYNFKDSSLKPNKNDKYNITVASFEVSSDHCYSDKVAPSLTIYLTQPDSIAIDNRSINSAYSPKYNTYSVRQKLDAFYDIVFIRLAQNEHYRAPYIHIVVSDTIDFNQILLPTLKILLKSYSNHLTNYLNVKYKTDVCTWNAESLSKQRGNLGFRILIDDFDSRKFRVNFKPPK